MHGRRKSRCSTAAGTAQGTAHQAEFHTLPKPPFAREERDDLYLASAHGAPRRQRAGVLALVQVGLMVAVEDEGARVASLWWQGIECCGSVSVANESADGSGADAEHRVLSRLQQQAEELDLELVLEHAVRRPAVLLQHPRAQAFTVAIDKLPVA